MTHNVSSDHLEDRRRKEIDRREQEEFEAVLAASLNQKGDARTSPTARGGPASSSSGLGTSAGQASRADGKLSSDEAVPDASSSAAALDEVGDR